MAKSELRQAEEEAASLLAGTLREQLRQATERADRLSVWNTELLGSQERQGAHIARLQEQLRQAETRATAYRQAGLGAAESGKGLGKCAAAYRERAERAEALLSTAWAYIEHLRTRHGATCDGWIEELTDLAAYGKGKDHENTR